MTSIPISPALLAERDAKLAALVWTGQWWERIGPPPELPAQWRARRADADLAPLVRIAIWFIAVALVLRLCGGCA